jgi:hypothetical protein
MAPRTRGAAQTGPPLSALMAAHARRRLFAAAGTLVVGVAGLLMLLSPGRATTPAEPERTTIAPAAPIVQGAGREQQGAGWPGNPAPSPGARAVSEDRRVRSRAAGPKLEQAEAAARMFLSALLQRESGQGGAQPARQIARHGTADFGRFVLKGEPRVTAATEAPAPARLVDLVPVGLGDGRAELAATIERDAGRSGLLVTLVRREGQWRVARLR